MMMRRNNRGIESILQRWRIVLNLISTTLEDLLVTNLNFVGGSPFDLISLEDRLKHPLEDRLNLNLAIVGGSP